MVALGTTFKNGAVGMSPKEPEKDVKKPHRPISEKVRVKKDMSEGFFGYYGNQRRCPGDVFTISCQEHFSDRWMERVKPQKKEISDE